MKCFYHPDKDAVGTCTQCGKAACRGCIEDIDGALLCKGCEAQLRDADEAARHTLTVAARRRVRLSWIFFAAVVVVSLVNKATASPLGSLFIGYLGWSVFWGVPPMWRRWWGMLKRVGCFLFANPITLLIIMLLLFEIPLVLGCFYGTFGGAIYEYLKCRRIAKSEI